LKGCGFLHIYDIEYKWNGKLAKRKKTDMIIVHHAAAKECSPADIHQWHLKNGWAGIGYNFIVRKNGKIFRGRPEDAIGAHTSNFNATSIGICFEGDFRYETPTNLQVKAGQELVAYLKQKYDITNVKRHNDCNNTSCPGKFFPFEQITNCHIADNLILEFQKAATADGFQFKSYGADGMFGKETEAIMKKCIVKKRYLYKYKNATKLVQKLLGVQQDGLCGSSTDNAIRKFQKEHGLLVDGAVGVSTWMVLLGVK
jgi:hypothetical protein